MPEGASTIDDLVVSVTGDVEGFRGQMVNLQGVLDQFSQNGATGIGLLDTALGKLGGGAAGLIGRFLPLVQAAQAALGVYDQFKEKALGLAEQLGVKGDVEEIAKAYDDLADALGGALPAASRAASEALKGVFNAGGQGGAAGLIEMPDLLEEAGRRVKDAMILLAQETAHGVRRLTTPDSGWSLETFEAELLRLQDLILTSQERLRSGMANGNEQSTLGRLLGIDEVARDIDNLAALSSELRRVVDLRNELVAKQQANTAAWTAGTSVDYGFLGDIDRQIQALELQAAVIGMGAAAAARYTAQQRMLQEAQRDGIALAPEVLARIDAEAARVGASTEKLEAKKQALKDNLERERLGEKASAEFARQDKQVSNLLQQLERESGNARSRLAGVGGNREAMVAADQEQFFQRIQAQGLVLTAEQMQQAREHIELKHELGEAIKAASDRMRMFDDVGSAVTRSMGGVFKAWANGAKVDLESVRDTARGMLVELSEVIFRRMVLDQLASGISGGLNSAGGALASGLGSLFGGAREMGGPVQPGLAYLVGEKRPELFVPDRPGMILPSVPAAASSGGSSGGSTTNVVIDARGAYPESIADIRKALEETKAGLPGRIVEVVHDAKERGGL